MEVSSITKNWEYSEIVSFDDIIEKFGFDITKTVQNYFAIEFSFNQGARVRKGYASTDYEDLTQIIQLIEKKINHEECYRHNYSELRSDHKEIQLLTETASIDFELYKVDRWRKSSGPLLVSYKISTFTLTYHTSKSNLMYFSGNLREEILEWLAFNNLEPKKIEYRGIDLNK
ncbi:MAG: hypothetical protein GPJ54_10395 [Candidatus Heimdallarchaeota archaeon]|nr:hypothetical protein [Candidatus Heimdallarchaeota archaeon]